MDSRKTKKARLLAYLQEGNSITQGVARSRFGIQSLSSTVADLRRDGMCIYTNFSNGVAKYRLGKPSREIIAAAYRAKGPAVFGNALTFND